MGFPPKDSRGRETPWTVFQDGSNNVISTGSSRSQRRRRRLTPGTRSSTARSPRPAPTVDTVPLAQRRSVSRIPQSPPTRFARALNQHARSAPASFARTFSVGVKLILCRDSKAKCTSHAPGPGPPDSSSGPPCSRRLINLAALHYSRYSLPRNQFQVLFHPHF